MAGALVQRFGLSTPFVAATLAGLAAACTAAYVFRPQKRQLYVPASDA
jgi:hypothetical protein